MGLLIGLFVLYMIGFYLIKQIFFSQRQHIFSTIRSRPVLKGVELELEETRMALRNLMAVINGDGGHKSDEFESDIEAAVYCEGVVMELKQKIEELKRYDI